MSPANTTGIPIVLVTVKDSWRMKKEKMAVNTGMKLVKMLARVMPISRIAFVKKMKESVDGKSPRNRRGNSAPQEKLIASVSGKSVRMKIGRK